MDANIIGENANGIRSSLTPLNIFLGERQPYDLVTPHIGVTSRAIFYGNFTRAETLTGYTNFFYKRSQRRLNQYDDVTLRQALKEYSDILRWLDTNVGPLVSSYDRDVIFPTTCALSLLKPAHFDLDEKGILGIKRSYRYPEELMSIIIEDFKRRLPTEDPSLSLKRGTNLGWPTQKGGRSREEGDVLLFAHVALELGARRRGLSLKDLTTFLSGYHGKPYAVAGERYQPTERFIPIYLRSASYLTQNIGPRCRGIYFSPKYMVSRNRQPVKQILHAFLDHPMHSQDRAVIKARMNDWIKRGWIRISVDVSRFDQSHGGEIGLQALKMLARIQTIRDEQSCFADFATEFQIPILVPTNRSLLYTNGGEILSSGLSTTSLINTVCSHGIAYEFACTALGVDFAQAHNSFGKTWDAFTWGDDVCFAYDPAHAVVKDVESLLELVGKRMELSFDKEPTLKFLGQNYEMKDYPDATLGYPIGRFVQQQIFPERQKDGPFFQIGYIARLLLLDERVRNEIHRVLRASHFPWRELVQFDLSQIPDVLKKASAEVDQYSVKISQSDDIVNVFRHGLDLGDAPLSDVEDQFPEFADVLDHLLGEVTMDFSDPEALASTDQFKRFGSFFQSLMKGELNQWFPLIQAVSLHFSKQYFNLGDAYY